MKKAKPLERTIESVNWCSFDCSYCSTDCVRDLETGDYRELLFQQVVEHMHEAKEDGVSIIHVSGGEPLVHNDIGWILLEARHVFGRGVVLHSNLVPQIAYNPNVLEGVDVHCYMTPKDIDTVHVLKRIRQGREARAPISRLLEADFRRVREGKEPRVHCSSNWRHRCAGQCGHLVVRADNTVVAGPCMKTAKARRPRRRKAGGPSGSGRPGSPSRGAAE